VLASGWSLVLLVFLTGFLLFFQTFLLGWFGYVLATILMVSSFCNFSKFNEIDLIERKKKCHCSCGGLRHVWKVV
jgi:hypothetical protein